MKVIGINGSPRRQWNTATLVGKALEGAASAGAQTEIVNLYSQTFKGCISCFACKRKGSKTNGLCAVRDELTPILKKALEADAIVIGGTYLLFISECLFSCLYGAFPIST